jgi:hypothetical protein
MEAVAVFLESGAPFTIEAEFPPMLVLRKHAAGSLTV